jgi:hypothetical protein
MFNTVHYTVRFKDKLDINCKQKFSLSINFLLLSLLLLLIEQFYILANSEEIL